MMMSIFTEAVAILTFLATCGCHTEASAGLRITVTENTLQNINQVELNALRNDLNNEQFAGTRGNSNGFDWKISNIRIPEVGDFQPGINLHSDGRVTWTCSISSIKMKGDYSAKQDLGFLGDIEIDGSVEARVKTTYISITLTLSENSGGLGIRLSDCSASIDNLDITFSGDNLVTFLLNLIEDFFRDEIKDQLSNEICEQIENGMTKLRDDMKTIDTSFPIKVIGLPLTLDNSFTDVTVSRNTISVYSKGAVQWNDLTFQSYAATPFPSSTTTLGISFDLREDVINNLLQTVVDSGQLDGMFSYSRVIQKDWKEFSLTCSADNFCLGNILEKTTLKYPERVVGMKWKVHSASLNIREDQIIGELTGRVNFSADSINESLPLFSAQLELAVPFQLKFSEGIISARAVNWGGHATVDQSNIGVVLSLEVLDATRVFLLPSIKTEILDIMNEHETEYAIKLPRNVHFQSSRLRLLEGVVRTEADLCYKSVSCQTIANDDWVGRKNISSFSVNDVITTTTSSSTTTTTATTTTTMTTTTTPATAIDVSGQTSCRVSIVNLLSLLMFVVAVLNTESLLP